MLIAIAYVLHIFLWNLRGKEAVRISGDRIILTKTGGLISSNRYIEFSELDDIYVDQTPRSFWMKYWRPGGCAVGFRYLGMEKRFGQDLSIVKAQRIVSEIKSIISNPE